MAIARKHVLLMIETSQAFGREILHGISQYLVSQRHWSVWLDQRELMVQAPPWLKNWQGDGIISRYSSPELKRLLDEKNLPAVDLTDVHGNIGLPHIWMDHKAVGRMAATHLLERGYRNFAYCGFSGQEWSRVQRDGFLSALPKPNDCQIYETPWMGADAPVWEDQQNAMKVWLSKLPRPVGVMACNDSRGQHVLDACRRVNLAVPEEVAVIGVDNDELICNLCDPQLSSVVVNARKIGFEAAQMLDLLMAKKKPPRDEVLVEPIGIITRQSTDVLAIDNPEVATAVRFIREHACEGISVTELLTKVNMTRSVLERLFRKYLQRSPQQEIRLAQLKRVKELLAETELPLADIAQATGFKHNEYLSVLFKRELGITPGEYRRSVQPKLSSQRAQQFAAVE